MSRVAVKSSASHAPGAIRTKAGEAAYRAFRETPFGPGFWDEVARAADRARRKEILGCTCPDGELDTEHCKVHNW